MMIMKSHVGIRTIKMVLGPFVLHTAIPGLSVCIYIYGYAYIYIYMYMDIYVYIYICMHNIIYI